MTAPLEIERGNRILNCGLGLGQSGGPTNIFGYSNLLKHKAPTNRQVVGHMVASGEYLVPWGR